MNLKDKELLKNIEKISIERLNINKEFLLENINVIDLTQQDINGHNILMYIIKYNNDKKLGFDKFDILNLLDRFNLKQKTAIGMHVLQIIIQYNKKSRLGFNKNDILSILDKFDLNQKSIFGKSVYDFIIQEKFIFDHSSLPSLISKLNIEMTDKNNDNILIKELKRGLFFDSEKLVQKILNTENKEIINCVYEHIEQIKWKQAELLIFLSKNNLKIKDNIVNII